LVASINSLTSFHAAFNLFYKDYFPTECLYENCCDEFYLFYKDYACHKDQFCDEVVIMEESIFHEEHEVLNDIHYDRDNIETSGIISDVSVVLSIHEDQHVSSEYPNVEEKVYYAEDIHVLEIVSEQISPRISQPASVLHPPVYSENIE
jgi:hypothetical protein